MLDIKTATTIRNSVNKYFSSTNFTLEEACRMEPLPGSTKGSSYTVLGMQRGDLSILAWVQFDEKLGVMVHKVHAQPW